MLEESGRNSEAEDTSILRFEVFRQVMSLFKFLEIMLILLNAMVEMFSLNILYLLLTGLFHLQILRLSLYRRKSYVLQLDSGS